MYTVNNAFSTALRPFSGTSRNSFPSPNGIIADATRTASRTVDFIESKRLVPLEPALYIGDNLYFCPEDADTILDIIPGGGRSATEPANFVLTTAKSISMDYNHQKVQFTTEWRNGMKLLRIQPGYIQDTPIKLNDCESLTDNGTVTASGDASNLATNTVFYLNGSASLDFDITSSSGNATVTFASMEAVDISSITRDGAITLGVFIPEALVGKVASLQIRVGSSDSNYYQMTATTTAYGGSFVHGFNVVRFERRTATTVGTVDESAINYLRVQLAHDLAVGTTVVGVKLDAIYAHKGIGYNLSYYSDFHFQNADTGAFLKNPTSVGLADKIIVNNDSFELIVQEAIKIMDMALRGEKAGMQYKNAERELNGIWGDFSRPGMYEQYRLRYPSERRSVINQYEAYPYE